MRCVLETAYVAMNRLLRVIPVRTQKAKRRTVDKVPIFLENTHHPEQDLMGISIDDGHHNEVSNGNEEHVIGPRRKGHLTQRDEAAPTPD